MQGRNLSMYFSFPVRHFGSYCQVLNVTAGFFYNEKLYDTKHKMQ